MTTGKGARRLPLATRAHEEQLALLFKALGDLNRLRVLAALLAGESSVGKIAMATGLPRTTVSRAVSLFLRHDLLKRGRFGGALVYSPASAHLQQLVDAAGALLTDTRLPAQSRLAAGRAFGLDRRDRPDRA